MAIVPMPSGFSAPSSACLPPSRTSCANSNRCTRPALVRLRLELPLQALGHVVVGSGYGVPAFPDLQIRSPDGAFHRVQGLGPVFQYFVGARVFRFSHPCIPAAGFSMGTYPKARWPPRARAENGRFAETPAAWRCDTCLISILRTAGRAPSAVARLTPWRLNYFPGPSQPATPPSGTTLPGTGPNLPI